MGKTTYGVKNATRINRLVYQALSDGLSDGHERTYMEIGQYRWSISWPVLGTSDLNGIRLAPSAHIVWHLSDNGFSVDALEGTDSAALRAWMNTDKGGKATTLKSLVYDTMNAGLQDGHSEVYVQIGQYIWTLS